MDITSSFESVLHVVNSRKDSRMPVNLKEKQSIDDLEGSFRDILRVQDIQERECKRKETCIDDGFQQPKPRAFDKCLSKCKTSGVSLLPDNKVESETGSHHPSEITVIQPLARSISLPLASAMKGSRAHRDATPTKLTVKWAPDIYDPPQTLLSHTVKNKKQIQLKSKNKKNGRKGQKSNAVRGSISSGKDKKQVRRDKSVSTHRRLVGSYGEIADFVCSRDPYCGNNFLINSVTKVHYSVAEAL